MLDQNGTEQKRSVSEEGRGVPRQALVLVGEILLDQNGAEQVGVQGSSQCSEAGTCSCWDSLDGYNQAMIIARSSWWNKAEQAGVCSRSHDVHVHVHREHGFSFSELVVVVGNFESQALRTQ